jgi:hypothetical protein
MHAAIPKNLSCDGRNTGVFQVCAFRIAWYRQEFKRCMLQSLELFLWCWIHCCILSLCLQQYLVQTGNLAVYAEITRNVPMMVNTLFYSKSVTSAFFGKSRESSCTCCNHLNYSCKGRCTALFLACSFSIAWYKQGMKPCMLQSLKLFFWWLIYCCITSLCLQYCLVKAENLAMHAAFSRIILAMVETLLHSKPVPSALLGTGRESSVAFCNN